MTWVYIPFVFLLVVTVLFGMMAIQMLIDREPLLFVLVFAAFLSVGKGTIIMFSMLPECSI